MTELAQQANTSTLVERNDRCSARVTNDLQFEIFTVRQGEGLDAELDDAALEQRFCLVGQYVLLNAAENDAIPHDTALMRLCLELPGVVSAPKLRKMPHRSVFRGTGYATVFRTAAVAF